mmetsp:Transcript_22427/g.64406  ORF Transcript_22427/g.64406 Transcript_22427/m.64406 type:complete len:112 (+) Transcript_22427:250-585(+)
MRNDSFQEGKIQIVPPLPPGIEICTSGAAMRQPVPSKVKIYLHKYQLIIWWPLADGFGKGSPESASAIGQDNHHGPEIAIGYYFGPVFSADISFSSHHSQMRFPSGKHSFF